MKKVLALMLALCMVFLMAACAGTTKTDSTTAPADNAETNTESTEKKTIAFLPPAMISPYYASCINGRSRRQRLWAMSCSSPHPTPRATMLLRSSWLRT